MEQHSQTNPNSISDPKRVIEGQLRQCFGRVVYSHKTHEKCADILLSRLKNIKLWQIILSAVITGGFIAAVFGLGRLGAILGVVVSTFLLAINAYSKDYDLGELAQKHKQAASELWIIREKYLSLITDLIIGDQPIESVRKERDKLLEELNRAYAGSPTTTFKAYCEARNSLKNREEMTFADKEIDDFLPNELKRG